LVAVCVSLSLASGTLSARIGETPGQCLERYGTPVRTDAVKGTMEFQKSGFYIRVSFFEGRADSVTFWKLSKTSLTGVQWMSVQEIRGLLRANADGEEWQPGFPGNGEVAYSEGSGVDPWHTRGPTGLAAYYHYSVGAEHLSIKTLAHIHRKQAADWAAIRNATAKRLARTEAVRRPKVAGF